LGCRTECQSNVDVVRKGGLKDNVEGFMGRQKGGFQLRFKYKLQKK
jgi:hypothetical protein